MTPLKITAPVILFSISATVPAQEVLPQPDPQYKGDIGLTYDRSEPPQYKNKACKDLNYPPLPQANACLKPGEKRKPNVLIIMLDDVGFGDSATFGGPINTPTLSKLADNGLRYNRFHTTAICASTRAALLTGRNHHSAATGVITESGTGYPGYTGIIPKSTATIGEILKGNGYSTAWFGKNHNVPDNQRSSAGPFDRWPVGLGFEYFYGFVNGLTDQWYPILYENTTPVEPPKTPEEGYHLTTDLADKAITWIQNQQSIAPDKPFFVYFVPGAAHAPHHVPEKWRNNYQKQFQQGWDELRRETFKRQKERGVIPRDAILTCYPHLSKDESNDESLSSSAKDDSKVGKGIKKVLSSNCIPRMHNGVLSTSCHCPDDKTIPPWDKFDDGNNDNKDSQKQSQAVAARLMENYAGFIEHTDYEIGRVIQTIKEIKEFDNTLIFYIFGDNGGAPNGEKLGTTTMEKNVNAYPETTIDRNFKRIDDIGTPNSEPAYNLGWGWASNTPFQWYKGIASHFGGTRNPMVISWPAGLTKEQRQNNQGMRSQFHHVIDIVPTILEAAGIEAPIKVNGVDQKPFDGVSMAYTFDNHERKSRRLTQYFEMNGNRAIYHKGWVAAVHHHVDNDPKRFDLSDDKWELYYIDRDFSQAVDLAESPKLPNKLNYLKDIFWAEAGRYNVLPLDDRGTGSREGISSQFSYTYDRTQFELYPGAIRLSESDAPDVKNRSYTITVDVDFSSFFKDVKKKDPKKDAKDAKDAKDLNGVLVAHGGLAAGYSLYLQNGRLKYTYNWFDVKRYTIEATEDVKIEDLRKPFELQFKFTYDRKKNCAGADGTGKFYISRKDVTHHHNNQIGRTVPGFFGLDAFDVGVDMGSLVVKEDSQSLDSDVTPYQDFAHIPFAGLKKVTFELGPRGNYKTVCQWD
jgi:arylsulfatase